MSPWARPAVRAGRGGVLPSMPHMACAAALAVAAFAAGTAQAQYGDALLPNDCYEYADVGACLDHYCVSYWDTYGFASYSACLADPFAHAPTGEGPLGNGEAGADLGPGGEDGSPAGPGTVAFDSDRYGIGDTVTVTVRDDGLNADPGRIDSYGIDPGTGFVGERGRIILDITLDGQPWSAAHADPGCLAVLEYATIHAGLDATGFSLAESGRDTGVFTGSFQVPREWCPPGARHPGVPANIGLEANYFGVSGTAPAGARAAVVAHSGSVSLDRTVYPVPFGEPRDFIPLPALVAEEDAARGALDRLEALHELQDLVYTAMDEQLLYPRELAHTLEGDMRSLFAGVRGGSDDWNDILDSLDDAIDDAEDETYGMRDLDVIVRDRTRAQLDLAAEREGADPWGMSYFPIHSTGFGSDEGIAYIPNGHLVIHIRVSDADYDVSAAGRDEIAEDGDGR